MTMTATKVNISQPLGDNTTGLKNEIIKKFDTQLEYTSTATMLQIQKDRANLLKFEEFKEETFKYFQQQIGPLNMLELIKQLVADVEYCFKKDKKSGQQKAQLVYNAFWQYCFQIDNFQYDTLTKANVMQMIEDVFKHNKNNLIQIAAALHKGIKIGVNIVNACFAQ